MFYEVQSFQNFGKFVYFLKAFIRTVVLTVFLFWELSQGTHILVVFRFKVEMRSAVFRNFCWIYSFIFRSLMMTKVFSFIFKVFMRIKFFRVFSFIYIFISKIKIWWQEFSLDFLAKEFKRSRVYTDFLVHLHFFS